MERDSGSPTRVSVSVRISNAALQTVCLGPCVWGGPNFARFYLESRTPRLVARAGGSWRVMAATIARGRDRGVEAGGAGRGGAGRAARTSKPGGPAAEAALVGIRRRSITSQQGQPCVSAGVAGGGPVPEGAGVFSSPPASAVFLGRVWNGPLGFVGATWRPQSSSLHCPLALGA